MKVHDSVVEGPHVHPDEEMRYLRRVPKKSPSKKSVPTKDEADPRFIPVADAFSRTPGFSLMESKSGALRGLMANGKSFGMSSHGRFILKLNEDRVASLMADGIGKPFNPTAGRVMKGWIEVTHPKADWVKLAKEAHLLATSPKKKKASG